uniref:Uncharacterized protein n=1 Tax=Pseudomonas fluorescens (strain SBW25) TaxID=216595 RepID=A4V7I3_PSEFS|nr:hypothetical protein pQBR0088 [Pseudomonas fluorescens SBW25]
MLKLGFLTLQPTLYSIIPVFSFPLFQSFVVSALGFNDFTGMRILVYLDLARRAMALLAGHGFRSLRIRSLRIQDSDHVTQTLGVCGQQVLQLGFELELPLQLWIILEG